MHADMLKISTGFRELCAKALVMWNLTNSTKSLFYAMIFKKSIKSALTDNHGKDVVFEVCPDSVKSLIKAVNRTWKELVKSLVLIYFNSSSVINLNVFFIYCIAYFHLFQILILGNVI